VPLFAFNGKIRSCALSGRPDGVVQAIAAMSSKAPEIFELDRVEIAVEPWSWEFALARRDEIDRYFASCQRDRPALWNGRVLLLNRYAIRDRVLRGTCFETDYASFLAWRDWDFADPNVFNIFATSALRAADGAFLLGEMAPSTAGAGMLCFPGGTPDPEDIGTDNTLDLAGSLSRELREETGIDIAMLTAEPGWCLVRDRGYLALMKRLTARQNAQQLRLDVMRHLANDAQPEFSAIHIVRGQGDLDPRMPRFLVAFLEAAWANEINPDRAAYSAASAVAFGGYSVTVSASLSTIISKSK
jgi:8-oxo-dGTP pyrophosphatase MutT (NUDIX family)